MHNPIEEFIELNIADRNSPIDLINRIFDDMENSASENIEYQLSDTHQTQLSNLFENISSNLTFTYYAPPNALRLLDYQNMINTIRYPSSHYFRNNLSFNYNTGINEDNNSEYSDDDDDSGSDSSSYDEDYKEEYIVEVLNKNTVEILIADQCNICMDAAEEKLYKCNQCSFSSHKKCIIKYINQYGFKCPQCKREYNE